MMTLVGMLASCTVRGDRKNLHSEVRSFELIDVNPPKRLYVILKDIKTGEYHEEYVAKRCSGYERVPIGSIIQLEYVTYTYEGDSLVYSELRTNKLYDIFCR